MCGVVLSNSLMAGKPTSHPNRYPTPDMIADIFFADDHCFNLIHYRPPAHGNIAASLRRAFQTGGPNCHGIQVNTPANLHWTPTDHIRRFADDHPKARIVVQIGPAAIKDCSKRPSSIANRAADYAPHASRFIIDPSAGNGLSLDVKLSTEIANAIAERIPQAAITFAGGLSPANTPASLRQIALAYPHPFSIDAEGALRTADDHLDLYQAENYLRSTAGHIKRPAVTDDKNGRTPA